MAKAKNILKRSLGLFALGYGLGVLTAPRSGRQTRKHLKKAADNSVSDIEKDLKKVYSQTKDSLSEFNRKNPSLNSKLKTVSSSALKSQAKVKELLSAIHGQDNVDDDLSAALNSAKSSLAELKKYLIK